MSGTATEPNTSSWEDVPIPMSPSPSMGKGIEGPLSILGEGGGGEDIGTEIV